MPSVPRPPRPYVPSLRGQRAETRPPAELPPRVPWRVHAAWLDAHWHAGQHLSIIAPTGGGKSYLIRHGLLPLWSHEDPQLSYRALIIDVKGDDPTYAGYGIVTHGFPQQEEGGRPPQDQQTRVYRLVVPRFEWSPSLKRESEGVYRARTIVGNALDRCYAQGQWLVVIDETRALSDSIQNFGLGLRGLLENIWQRGRSREVTMIAGTQAPRYVPSSFYDQPSLMYIGRTLDDRARDRLSEIGGDTRIIEATMPVLQPRQFLVVERDTGRMGIVQVGR